MSDRIVAMRTSLRDALVANGCPTPSPIFPDWNHVVDQIGKPSHTKPNHATPHCIKPHCTHSLKIPQSHALVSANSIECHRRD